MELNHIKRKNKMNSSMDMVTQPYFANQANRVLLPQRRDSNQSADVMSIVALVLTSLLPVEKRCEDKGWAQKWNNSRWSITKTPLMLTFMWTYRSAKNKKNTLSTIQIESGKNTHNHLKYIKMVIHQFHCFVHYSISKSSHTIFMIARFYSRCCFFFVFVFIYKKFQN